MSLSKFVFMVFVCAFCPSICFAQVGYQPIEHDDSYMDQIIQDMEDRYNKDIAGIDGKLKRERKNEYYKRYQLMVDKTQEGHFITDPSVNKYFTGILNNIITANPVLKDRNLRLLISRYDWPNASCHGEGSIVLNLGLINRLENESQVAFIICHELSHDYMNHVNKAIDEYVESVYSKAAQKELKRLRRATYNKYDQAQKMIKNISFDLRRHGREYEVEADSLALVFMKPTKYDTRAAIQALGLLDSIDVSKRSFLIDYKRHFDSEAFQVKNRWFVDESESAFNVSLSKEDQAIADSLKTHPDCQERINILQDFQHNKSDLSASSEFKQYIRLADYEIVASAFQFNHFGKALFYSFLLLEENPDDIYLHTMVVDCLYELYMHQKNHELGKVLDLPDSRYEENYNQFLNFLHNLRLRDLGKLGHFYALKNGTRFQDDEDFRVAELFAASVIESPDEWRIRKQAYFKDFVKGRYKSVVRSFKPFQE